MFKIKSVKPLFTGVVTTAMTYKGEVTTAGGLILDPMKTAGQLNPYQYVKAVGSIVQGIKEGDVVKINFKRYAVPVQLPGTIDEHNVQSSDMKMTYQIPKIHIDGVDYLFIQNNDIEYVVDDYDVDEGGLLQ